jgi:tryptophan synthase alpha chain
MNAIDAAFERLKIGNKKAFIPFIAAGDPDIESTKELAKTLAKNGASIIEIGFPYSDPIADGPVIQAAYTRALNKGLKIEHILKSITEVSLDFEKEKILVPFVAMVSMSIIHRFGKEKFIDGCLKAGFSGLIIPDLPVEESLEIAKDLKQAGLSLILLVTPNTPKERALLILSACSGFVYCVSVSGITGERDKIPEELLKNLAWLREQTPLPLCVGFGISKPEHAKVLRDHADGVIVGSAIVKHIETAEKVGLPAVKTAIANLAESLVSALNS